MERLRLAAKKNFFHTSLAICMLVVFILMAYSPYQRYDALKRYAETADKEIKEKSKNISKLEAKLTEQPKVVYREKQGLGSGPVNLHIECYSGSANPPVMPPEGRIYLLSPSDIIPAESAGGFSWLMGPAGSEAGLPKGFHKFDRCQITNHGTATVFNVSLTFPIKFLEAIKEGQQESSGRVTSSRDWPVNILHIGPGPSGAFVFYIVNGTSRVLLVDLPQVATLQVAGESEARSIRFLKPEIGHIALMPEKKK